MNMEALIPLVEAVGLTAVVVLSIIWLALRITDALISLSKATQSRRTLEVEAEVQQQNVISTMLPQLHAQVNEMQTHIMRLTTELADVRLQLAKADFERGHYKAQYERMRAERDALRIALDDCVKVVVPVELTEDTKPIHVDINEVQEDGRITK